MKTSIYLSLVAAISILVSCGSNQKSINERTIVGIWQNANNAAIAIEFTNKGEYFFRFQGERVLYKEPTSEDVKSVKSFNDSLIKDKKLKISDSKIEKYSYDSLSKGDNLKIFSENNSIQTLCRLIFIDPNRIILSLVDHDTVVSKAEYFRIRL